MPQSLTTAEARLYLLGEMLASSKMLEGVVAHLWCDDRSPVGPTTTLAELAAREASFPGYAPKTDLWWGLPFQAADGRCSVVADELEWVCEGPERPEVIGGAYFVQPGGPPGPPRPDQLIWVQRYDSPFVVQAAGQRVLIVPQFDYPA